MNDSSKANTEKPLEDYRAELASARAAERAIGEVLKIIGRSPDDLHEVLDALLGNALRLCDAELGILYFYDEAEGFRAAHMRQVPDVFADWLNRGPVKATPGTGLGRIEAHRKPINIPDVKSEDLYEKGDELRIATVDLGGARSFAAIPMLAGDELKGAFTIYRQQVRPFTQNHIDLLDRFSDQAVIAIENARLLNATRSLSAELSELNKSLQDQVEQQVTELERLSLLRRFLSPEIADIVLTSGDDTLLSSHRRKIAAMFCDLRGFTAFSEAAEPEEVMEVLETFHAETGKLVADYKGTISHRSGDGLMVILNDPVPIKNPAEQAVRLAHHMRNRLLEVCDTWQKNGYNLGVGIGLSLGYATLGLVGSKSRYDYTAIGTVVNIASRLCDEAAHGEVLLSQRVMAATDGLAKAEEAGEFQLKGASRPVKVYRLTSI